MLRIMGLSAFGSCGSMFVLTLIGNALLTERAFVAAFIAMLSWGIGALLTGLVMSVWSHKLIARCVARGLQNIEPLNRSLSGAAILSPRSGVPKGYDLVNKCR